MEHGTEFEVHIARDSETGRWYIRQSDIPGLWLEAATAQDLISRIAAAAPELIELNAAEMFPDGRPRQAAIRPVFDSPLLLEAA
jgi:predicted RNase H-like HicB family nuclease